MPKATPSKADLPKAPPRVREVKDEALMAQRVAEYNRLYAIYEEEMTAYKEGQQARNLDKKAAKRRAGKTAAEVSSSAAEAAASARGSPRSSAAPHSSAATPRGNVTPQSSSATKQPFKKAKVAATAPSARQLAAAVCGSGNCEHACEGSSRLAPATHAACLSAAGRFSCLAEHACTQASTRSTRSELPSRMHGLLTSQTMQACMSHVICMQRMHMQRMRMQRMHMQRMYVTI